MAIDCSDVPSNVTYSCANPWGANCTSRGGFQFTTLWNYTKSIQAACASDDRLFLGDNTFANTQNASLTQAACAAIAGSDWKSYPAPDIWNRLTTWKFPLLQLVVSFPRPPLSFRVECLVILHLLGDPIDTTKNLLLKMSVCQQIAESWKLDCGILLDKHMDHDRDHEQDLEDRNWKALAIITDAYGEWSEDTSAQQVLHTALIGFQASSELKENFMTAVRQTARALAADRSTKLLPIAVALLFFIGAVGIAIFRTAAAAGKSATSDTVFINVEAHSIAFSALYFWIIPAVFLSSIIGVSQTEAAIPRILRRFEVDLARIALPKNATLPEECVDDDGLVLPKNIKLLNECLKDDQKRIFHGGVYSWQPSKPVEASQAGFLWGIRGLLPYSIVILGTMAGMLVSSLVPPEGFDCRNWAELLICIIWILSAQAGLWLKYLWSQNPNTRKTLFWATFIKDFLAMAATMGGIIVTQVGIFNRCACYTNWGQTGLALPQMPDVASVLLRRLNKDYPAITFLCIGIEIIVFPLLISIQYRHAFRVFVQRDDRQSNAPWLWKTYRIIQACEAVSFHVVSFRPFKRSRPHRGVTSSGESGLRDQSIEMPMLTHEPESVEEEVADIVDEQPDPTANIPSNSFQSKTSSRESTLQSGSDALSQSDTRRRNTEPHRRKDEEAARLKHPGDEKLLHRKPLPGNSPLQEFHSRP